MTSERTTLPAGPLAVFPLAMLAMLPAQIFRLYQEAALPWLLADYAGRLLVLGLLLALPAGRAVLLREERLRVSRVEAVAWILGTVFFFAATDLFNRLGNWLPAFRLGLYPHPEGFLYFFDLTFGLALVALHEEIVSRRLAALALARFCCSAWSLVPASAALFAVFHWWTGLGSMLACFVFGIVAMTCYRRTGALWPVVLAHYALDVIAFA